MTMFSAPDVLADLDIGAVQRADGQGPVERKLHVAGAGGFHAGGRNLLGQIGRRHDRLGKRGAVIGREHHLQPAADDRIVVHHLRDVIGELDDQLGAVIRGGGLAGEDLHPRHMIHIRPRADPLVERDGLQQIEQLALVFMDALDVHIEQRVRIERNAGGGLQRVARVSPC